MFIRGLCQLLQVLRKVGVVTHKTAGVAVLLSNCIHCRSRKKLNYADLCDSEDDEPNPLAETRSQERPPQPDLLDRMQSPRGNKRPKSAPNSVIQQPIATPSAERQAKLKQALLLQMEMQRRLHDQLEVIFGAYMEIPLFPMSPFSLVDTRCPASSQRNPQAFSRLMQISPSHSPSASTTKHGFLIADSAAASGQLGSSRQVH